MFSRLEMLISSAIPEMFLVYKQKYLIINLTKNHFFVPKYGKLSQLVLG